MTHVSSSDSLRRTAARVAAGMTMLVAFLALALLTERIGYAGVYRGDADAAALTRQLLLSIPALLYLAGLWQLRQTASSVAAGERFSGRVGLGLRRLGELLIVGAATALLLPLVDRLLGNQSPRLIDYDVSTIIIAAIGAGLMFLARLIRSAATLEAELNEIF